MEGHLYDRFIKKLEEKYGKQEQGTSKFGDSSFGTIADDLCISKSQFTMLISNKGTEGMYIRSLRNINQLLKYDQQAQELKSLKKAKNSGRLLSYISFAVLLLLSGIFAKQLLTKDTPSTKSLDVHPFSLYFDGDSKSNYVPPYLKETEVQNYCPCSAYEGVWDLNEKYIIPLPSKKPGLYYVAKSSDVRLKCQKGVETDKKGKVLLGFENMHNELWIDTKRTPFSPRYFDADKKEYTETFNSLDVDTNPDFIKVCDIYSCFFDEFTVEQDFIFRRGEPCGRYAENINSEVIENYDIDVEHILKYVISSMAQIECNPMENLYCNPNTLEENSSVLEYNCMFKISTENLGIGGGYPYIKSYKLVKQNYAHNLLCNCDNS